MVRRQLRYACVTIAFAIMLVASTSGRAQLPFYTDDTDTTPKGKFHLEISNEYDWLLASSRPAKNQNTTVLTVNYGLTNHIELGVNGPLIRIFNQPGPTLGNVSGIGDTQFVMKMRLFDEREGSKRPSGGIVFYVEAPTGNKSEQLGSGLIDYGVYGLLQKEFTKRTTGRLNGGIVFAGNSSTGVEGIRSTRGQVFTGNGSLVRYFTPRLRLGAELFGGVTNKFDLSRGQLETQVGGGYMLTPRLEFTFGVVAGHFPASPRTGVQVGFAYDFK
jgi:hypothetical protein